MAELFVFLSPRPPAALSASALAPFLDCWLSSAILFITFSDFLMFYQIFLPP